MSQTEQPIRQVPPQPQKDNGGYSLSDSLVIGLIAAIAIVKAYADSQIKNAANKEALGAKQVEKEIESSDRMVNSVISQHNQSNEYIKELLSTALARQFSQSQVLSDDMEELIKSLNELTLAVKQVADRQEIIIKLLTNELDE